MVGAEASASSLSFSLRFAPLVFRSALSIAREDSLAGSSSPSLVRGPHSEARRSLMSSSMLQDPAPRPGYSPKPMLEVEKSESDSNRSTGCAVIASHAYVLAIVVFIEITAVDFFQGYVQVLFFYRSCLGPKL